MRLSALNKVCLKPLTGLLISLSVGWGSSAIAQTELTAEVNQETDKPVESIFSQTAVAMRIYEKSGVASHLVTVPGTIIGEAEFERTKCGVVSDYVVSAEYIEQLYSRKNMASQFSSQLLAELGEEKVRRVEAWYKTDLGKRIIKAESSAVGLEREQFNVLLNAYLQSTRWHQERADQVATVLQATKAVDFLSAVHTEISAAVAIAASCDVTKVNAEDVAKEVAKIRADEAFYLAFLRGEMVPPTAFVYRSLSRAELNAFTRFAQSDLGAEYFNALVKISRRIVADGVGSLAEISDGL